MLDFTGPIIEVKYENFPEVKLEDTEESDMEHQVSSVKV